MLHAFLALYCMVRSGKLFEIYKLVDTISFRVPLDKALLVLIDTPSEIVRDTPIDSAARSTCENVDVELPHRLSFVNRDGRNKPGHDRSN